MKITKRLFIVGILILKLNVSSAATDIEMTKDYLKMCQTIEGGWGNSYERPNLSVTAKALLAVRLNGEDPAYWTVNGKSPVDYLKWVRDNDPESVKKYFGFYVFSTYIIGATEKNGLKVEEINKYIRSKDFQENGKNFEANWLLLSAKFDDRIDKKALIDYLLRQQKKDGGWAYGANPILNSDIDSTAMVVMSIPPQDWPQHALGKAYEFLSQTEIENPFAASKKTNLPQMNLLYLSRLHLENISSKKFPYFEKSGHLQKINGYRRDNGGFLLTAGVAHNPCSSAVYGLSFLAGRSYAEVANVPVMMKKREGKKDLVASTSTPFVKVRIEGPDGFTLVEELKVVPQSYINPFDEKPIYEDRPTALLAVMAALKKAGISYSIRNLYGTILTDINGAMGRNWNYKINNKNAEICVSDLSLKDGDEVLYYSGEFDQPALQVLKTSFRNLLVKDRIEGKSVADAEVFINGKSIGFTDHKGEIRVPISLTESFVVVAEKAGFIRSEVFIWSQKSLAIALAAILCGVALFVIIGRRRRG
ncbi:hypothetical protein BDW_08445 [Bdellovibrio bacteriovorus W]|nr:hypothetical protein BDW_08445 [Bdellovibrio bacteriovorus W]